VVERINQDESRHLAMDMYLTEHFTRTAARSVAETTNPWTNADFWGVAAWGPAFFTDVFFRPMQALDPTQEQMREVMGRLRRFYDRPAVDGNPAVEQFRAIVAFFESALGSLVGRTLEDGIRWASGVDLAFVRSGGDPRS